jgi:hypothetical protein
MNREDTLYPEKKLKTLDPEQCFIRVGRITKSSLVSTVCSVELLDEPANKEGCSIYVWCRR